MIFPWQEEAWRQLSARRAALPHALLFRGPRGIGKRHFARVFAQSLLCESPAATGLPCGTCQACHWVGQGSHPDLRIVEPEAEAETDGEEGTEVRPARRGAAKAPSKFILIKQVRDVQDWVVMTSHRGGHRVAVFAPAEAMNAATSNALLKTLEEPPARAVLLLVSHDSAKLLPTIMSRCQRIDLAAPPTASARAWLASQQVAEAEAQLSLAGGAPLDALENPARLEVARLLVESLASRGREPIAMAEAVASVPPELLVDLLQKWGFDTLCVAAGASPRYFAGMSRELGAAARSLSPDRMWQWLQMLGEARGLVNHPLNPRLVSERLFVGYRDAVYPDAARD